MKNSNLSNPMIRRLQSTEAVPYDLLLLADETIDSINTYLPDSEIYVAEYRDTVLGVYVLSFQDNDTAEIKNIAVEKSIQGNGIGKLLLGHATIVASNRRCKSLLVGTPDVATRQLRFYENNGFVRRNIIRDYFVVHYPDPIFENGVQLRDMVVLSKSLHL